MDKMSESQLDVFQKSVTSCAVASLVLTTVSLRLIAHKCGHIGWLLLAPFSFVPLVKERIAEVERRTPLFLRLNAATSFSHWMLSLSIVVHVPTRRYICAPFAILMSWFLLTTIVMNGFVEPRLTDMIVVQRAPIGRAGDTLRVAAPLSIAVCLPVTALAYFLRSRSASRCFDLPRSLIMFQVPLFVGLAFSLFYLTYVHRRIERTKKAIAYNQATCDEDLERETFGTESGSRASGSRARKSSTSDRESGIIASTAIYRQMLFRRMYVASWSFYIITSIFWAIRTSRVLSPKFPPFKLVLVNAWIIALKGALHAVLMILSDKTIEGSRQRMRSASDDSRQSFRRSLTSLMMTTHAQPSESSSLGATDTTTASPVDSFATDNKRGADACHDMGLFLKRALPSQVRLDVGDTLDRSVVATTLNCAEAKSLRELLVDIRATTRVL